MFARNVTSYLLHLRKSANGQLDLADELTRGPLVTHQGDVVHEVVKKALGT
jgi:NAD(P) transhydrogenase subunit alpha